MKNSLVSFANDLSLKQSELYGNLYNEIEHEVVNTFSGISILNLSDWQNNVFLKYNFINDEQRKNLQCFFIGLSSVLKTIDPEKLRINDDSITEEEDVVFWRESHKGISKLFFTKYGQIIYNFNGNDGKKIRGIFENDVDFEKLLYRFLSL